MGSLMTPKQMPKGWKNPMRQPLYRVVVEARGEREPIAVCPGLLKEAADALQIAIKEQIAKGFETNWSNPTVVLCHI